MKSIWPAILLFTSCLSREQPAAIVKGQPAQNTLSKLSSGEAAGQLADKIFPLFSVLASDSLLSAAIPDDDFLASWRKGYYNRVAHCLDTCTSAWSLAQVLKWRPAEMDSVKTCLLTLYEKSPNPGCRELPLLYA